MNFCSIFRNPLDLIAEFWAEKRNIPVDVMRVRSRYLFFTAFPAMFSREEYLYLFKAMLDVYIMTLEVVYSNYPLSGNKFVLPSKRLNDLYMLLNGFMKNLIMSPRFESSCRLPNGKFSELRLNHQNNIQLWSSSKSVYMDLMSQITQDICLKTRYGIKPERFFSLLFDLLGTELQKHIFKRIKQGNDIYFNVPFPPSFQWVDDKTFSLGNDLKLVFDKPGLPQKILHHLFDLGGDWASTADIARKVDASEDSIRATISTLRKKISKDPKINERVGIQNDGSGKYRLGMHFILS
jgi:hypothetical protein